VNERRRFLRYLAGSPLLALSHRPQGPQGSPLADPAEALNVFDFHEAAKAVLPKAHYGYLATGVDDDRTLHANSEAFQRYQLRMRRLVDVKTVDTSIELMGTRWQTPIFLCPAGSQRAFHPEGEIAVAKAARAKGHLQILSTTTTSSVEEVAEARGAPIWYQLYPTEDWTITRNLLKRAEGAGCPVVALTVDLYGGSNRETVERFRKLDDRDCSVCHEPGGGYTGYIRGKPMFQGLDLSGAKSNSPADLSWDFVDRLKDATTMKLFLKGIVTGDDTALAIEHGVDGIVVSNHGGRAEESGRATIECLPEVAAAAGGRIPILIDGGFRRGTDVFKALALGADAVGIGRPYLWGLAAFGQRGVEEVLAILRRELEMVMRQAGTTTTGRIGREHVVDSRG
jgi:isopentenyl diphosphate isomerase/L-lactate dehydrogenase-like FMN-dependent dehydrogenase